MKVTLFQAILMSVRLFTEGVDSNYLPILKHCLWARKRGNELVDQGYSPDQITDILLREENQ